MLQAMIGSAKGKPNQMVYWSRLPDWKNQTLTPNPDVIYLMPFFNTKQGRRGLAALNRQNLTQSFDRVGKKVAVALAKLRHGASSAALS
jgi:hypothetical protein